DLMMIAPDGRGAVNVLAANELMKSPQLYATFLLWLLAELFENLPEVGDLDKPKLVFFFDEAHLLFNDAPKALVTQVEQVVRLIRSKGVGVYFVTQSPLDVPETVLGQLGHRIQHALRAFTPRDQKAVRAAAETFRPNPRLDTAQAIQELGKGEALVSLLDGDGVPSIVQRVLIAPPASSLAVLSDEDRRWVVGNSPLKGVYDQAVDRESAYEKLRARATPAPSADTGRQSTAGGWTRNNTKKAAPRQRETTTEAAVKSVARSLASSIGSSLGRQIVRGVLGAILKR
ncbi:MAG: helicase HerA-like domain-containing protein, partial [Rhodospirillales bacterium]